MKKIPLFIFSLLGAVSLFAGVSVAHAATTYSLEPIIYPTGLSSPDIKVDISNVPIATTVYIQVCNTGEPAAGLCAKGGADSTSGPISVAATTGSTPSVAEYVPSLSIGTYYVQVLASPFNGQLAEFSSQPFTVSTGVNVNTSGGGTPVANTTYTLLQPLPLTDDTGAPINNGVVNVATGVGSYINSIIRLIIGITGVLAVFMIVFGGIQYMATTSAGEKGGAKERITNAILGLVLAVGSFIILNTINPRLVSLGVSVPQAGLTLDPDTYTPTAGSGSGGSGPNVTSNISQYDSLLKAAASKYGNVDCTLAKAIMYAESSGDPTANSGQANGLMQLTPATFSSLSSGNANTPADNIDAGVHYISNLESTACNGTTSNSVCNVSNMQDIAAAYNGGPKANGFSTVCQKGQGTSTTAWQCTLNSGYAQTRVYAPRVAANYQILTSKNWGC